MEGKSLIPSPLVSGAVTTETPVFRLWLRLGPAVGKKAVAFYTQGHQFFLMLEIGMQ